MFNMATQALLDYDSNGFVVALAMARIRWADVQRGCGDDERDHDKQFNLVLVIVTAAAMIATIAVDTMV